ncbi:MAG: tetratricopeptide repeat protein [Candidatus Heimdallarchaeota archaeon]
MGTGSTKKSDFQIEQLLNIFLREPNKALKLFQQAYQLHSDNAIVLYYWGVVLGLLNRFEEAIEKLKRAHQLQPNDPRPLYVWGAILAELGQHDEAQKKFERADDLLMRR